MAPPSLDAQQKDKLQKTLDDLAQVLPGCFLTVVTPTETLFNGQSGKFDMLKSDSRDVTGEDVMWFASTTKLITSVCESFCNFRRPLTDRLLDSGRPGHIEPRHRYDGTVSSSKRSFQADLDWLQGEWGADPQAQRQTHHIAADVESE